MLLDFRNRRVVVAGAAHGLGRAIAEAFAHDGAQVTACDILADEVAAFAGARPGGGTITALPVDVTNADAIATVVTGAEEGAGAVDILVYVAGGVLGEVPHPIEEVDPERFRRIVEVNLTGAFLFARAVAPGMKRVGRGRIITISSRAGLATSLTGIQGYASAKHGQVGLVRQLAQELGPFGITVNSVAPGFFATNPDSERQWAGYPEEFRRDFLNRIAMRRMGDPADIANAVLFFASDQASWITGQTLLVTGSPLA